MTIMIGYIRVSTIKQVKGHSLDFQKDAIERYCEFKKWELDKRLYKDGGVSATVKRPDFGKAFERVMNDNNINGIITYDLTRFGRDTIELLTNIKLIENKGKEFVSIKENIDTTTKTGKLMLTLLSGIADFERESIRERLIAGREWAKIHGTKSGKPMHRPKKEVDWEFVKEMREIGLSWNKISKLWNRKTINKKEHISVPTLIKRSAEEGIE